MAPQSLGTSVQPQRNLGSDDPGNLNPVHGPSHTGAEGRDSSDGYLIEKSDKGE
mgnify:CR=1 FL=1